MQDTRCRAVHAGRVNVDLAAAEAFLAAHARVLDLLRFRLLMDQADPGSAVAGLDAYRNPDGGYGWGLEPDLRSPESQPGAALHALEVFEDIAPATAPQAVALCDWLASVCLPDGGLPFARPVTNPAGCAPFWAQADPTVSSLQITAVVAATVYCVAAHDPAVAAHPWLAQATRYCLAAIQAIRDTPPAIELAFAMQPLDVAPTPDRPVRALFTPEIIAAELQRLIDQQQDDGGWTVDFASYSPAAALEWRGYMTVRAVSILHRNHRS